MKFKDHLDEIKEIRENSENITQAAKEFCKKHNIGYNDGVRRAISGLLKERKRNNPKKKTWQENFEKNTAYFEGIVDQRIITLDDAIKVSGADLSVWEVERWICNSWEVASKHRDQDLYFEDGVMTGHAVRKNKWIRTTNFQIKVWFKKKQVTTEEKLKEILPVLKKYTPKKINKKKASKGIGVASFADFHIGAEIKNLLKTKDFDIAILLDYISKAVDIINSHNYSKVYVNLLGDFFESLSGMNHENTFKSLGKDMWGANAIIVANEIIAEHLLSKINNLVGVNIVSGNHDRMTSSNKLDNTGEGGKVLWYMLKKDFPTIPVIYHNSVITQEIDGVNYLLTHGDKGYSKKDFSKFVLDYGKTNIYNLVIEGHLHTRRTLKSMSVEKKYYQEQEVVSYDDSNYRKLIAPSLFTGNWYSESLGFGGNAGMIITESNGNGGVHVFDYTL